MKANALRIFLVLVLVASLVVRYQSIRTRDSLKSGYDIAAAISRLLTKNGMTLFENPVKPPRILADIVYFSRPNCTTRSLVVPFSFASDALTKINRLGKKGYDVRYYFFDTGWPEQNRIGMFLAWVKTSALSAVGASPYLPVLTAIALVEAPQCSSRQELDWQSIWVKLNDADDRQNAAGSASSETTKPE